VTPNDRGIYQFPVYRRENTELACAWNMLAGTMHICFGSVNSARARSSTTWPHYLVVQPRISAQTSQVRLRRLTSREGLLYKVGA